MTFLLFIIGLVLLTAGAEVLVRGAARLAVTVGISPLVIGLTVVAFATSSPELAVGIQASLLGEGDIVLGNVIGSNIFNILFILGVSAMIAPLIVNWRLVQFDVPIMIGSSVVLWLLALDGSIGRLDGLLLFAGIITYTVRCIRQSRAENASETTEIEGVDDVEKVRQQHWIMHIILMVLGLVMLGIGSRWLVEGAVTFARLLGVSELIIGVTIVAVGTSLPEVATSVVASLRGERDIAVGNIVGSNIFNILSVMGFVALVAPEGINVISSARWVDLPIVIGIAVACLPIFFSGRIVTRWEGGLFFAYYVAYMTYILLSATQHPALPFFGVVMLLIILPLTIVLLWVGIQPDLTSRQGKTRLV